MSKMGFVVVAITLLALVGCSSHGVKMDENRIKQIQKGVTTRAEVESLLGPATHVSMMPDGKRMMMYQYHEAKVQGTSFIPFAGGWVGGTDQRHQTLQIFLNKDGIVEDYEYADESSENENIGGQQKIQRKSISSQ